MPRDRRKSVVTAVLAATLLGAGGTAAGVVAAAPRGPQPGDRVELAEVVASWPTEWSVTGTKSEPQYVEHLAFSRDGDDFTLTIDLVAQGSQRGGVSALDVTVERDGTVIARGDCGGGCGSEVRGFLTTATLLSRAHTGQLPGTATVHEFAGRPVVCVRDAELFPGAPPFHLDPCFDLATGAVLAHRSEENDEYAGATLHPRSIAVTPHA